MDIFELLNNKFDLCKQIHELNVLMFEEKNVFSRYRYYCSFSDSFDDNLLRTWKYAYGRIKLIDLMKDIGLVINDNHYALYPHNEKTAMNSLQLNANMLFYAYDNKTKLVGEKEEKESFFKTCFNKVEYIIDKAGMRMIKHEEHNYYVIVPRDENVRIIAEKVDKDTAFLLYEYTSPLNKGEYKKKREILKLIANKIEPISKKYRTIYQKGLGADVFNDLDMLLNNFEIRHSNMDSTIEKNYKEALNKYTAKEWEEIYDTVYQMMLNAFAIDNYNNIHSKTIQKHKQNIGLEK